MKRNRAVIAAIDFGTTYTGYAYCKRVDYDKDKVTPSINCHLWNSGASLTNKAPTCVLFTPKMEFHSFGYEAINFYHDNPKKEDLTKWYYFEYFKMMLYQEKDLTTDTYLHESRQTENPGNQKKIKAVDVFGAVLGFIKQSLMNDIRGTETNEFLETDLQWVITVPAIWDLRAKQFMRDAAKKAGISHDQITLALEPEAASLFCRRVPVGVETQGDGRKVIAAMNVGAKYIVLDQGGGTTDIAVHEVTGLNKLKEIHQACGGRWGGITVNEKFEEFLEQLFGDEFMKHMKETNPSAYFTLLRNFEHTKTGFKSEDEKDKEGKTTIRIPVEWSESLQTIKKCSLNERIDKSNYSNNVSVYKDRLRIKNTFFRTFYDFSIANVTSEMAKLIDKPEVRGVKTLLVVGGHSASSILIDALKESFRNLVVVVPKDPGVTVLKGAVLFGFEPETITSRVSRFTYGIGTTRNFHKGRDPEKQKIMVDGKEKCKDVFDKHIEIGQILEVGEDKFLPGKEYVPLYKDQKTVSFRFFDTLVKSPQYTSDSGCRNIGSLTFELTEGMTGSKEMILKVNNSGTELVAVVTEVSTKKETKGYFRLPEDKK